MKNFYFLLVALVIFSTSVFSQEKLITGLPKNIESIYGGVTLFGTTYHDNDGHAWWETTSKVRVAMQTSFDIPLGELKIRSAHDFISNETALHFFIHSTITEKLALDYGYKGMPVTFLHRGNPFLSSGQFEYASQLSIPGSCPSATLSYKINSLTIYGAFGERNTSRKVMIPESQTGFKYDFSNDVSIKAAASWNKDVNQQAVTLSVHQFYIMAGADNHQKMFSYVDYKPTEIIGHLYIDYVSQNKKDSYLEFGQYWDKDITKDLVASVGWGYNTVKDYFYIYSFVHI